MKKLYCLIIIVLYTLGLSSCKRIYPISYEKTEEEPTFQTMEFGYWPQNLITGTISLQLNELVNVPTKTNKNGWSNLEGSKRSNAYYIDIDFEESQYRGIYYTSPVYYAEYAEENGFDYDKIYWFKYEPITWLVVEETENELTLITLNVIDSMLMFQYPGLLKIYHEYEKSEIRQWLNSDFLESAFEKDEISKISEVSNPNSFMNNYSNKNNLETLNMVWLPSYTEVNDYLKNEKYILSEPTDYARSLGCICIGENYQYSSYWTRSSNNQYFVIADINGFNLRICEFPTGIRPMIKIEK